MKYPLFLLLLLVCTFGYAQDNTSSRWYHTAELDFIFIKDSEYQYRNNQRKVVENLNSVFSFGIIYSFNYQLIAHKLSIGPIVGTQFHFNPELSMIKIGANTKFFFIDQESVYLYLQLAHDISLNTEKFNEGTNGRIGLGIPIADCGDQSLNLGIFAEQNFLLLDNPETIIPFESTIIFKSYGFNLVMKF